MALGLGDWESCDSMSSLQTKAAQRENEGLAPIEVGVADDHGLHIAEHGRYMMTEEFQRMKKQGNKRAEDITKHYMMHLEARGNEGV